MSILLRQSAHSRRMMVVLLHFIVGFRRRFWPAIPRLGHYARSKMVVVVIYAPIESSPISDRFWQS